MKDLIEKILKYLPQYFADFGSILCGPKTFIAKKDLGADGAFGDALIFLGISLVLVVLMTFPLLPPGKDLWTYVGATAVRTLLTVALSGAAVRLAWWIVGGRAPAQSFFIIYSYFFGIILVIVTGIMLLGEGTFKVFDPELYANVLEAKLKKQPMPDLSGSRLLYVEAAIVSVGFILLAVWNFISWGAYRHVNGLSKTRSFWALTVATFLIYPAGAVAFLIGAALR